MSQPILELSDLRSQINQVDDELIKLLAHRRNLAAQVAEYKIANNKPVKDSAREHELMSQLVLKAADAKLNLPLELLNSVYRSVLTDSVNYQQEIITQRKDLYKLKNLTSVKIAYLGLPGSYSYIAAKKFASFLGKHGEVLGEEQFSDVVSAVVKGSAQFAILPLENTNSGSINEVYDILSKTSLQIVADLSIDINHVYCAKSVIAEKEIEVIYTHAQPYEQSKVRIRELCPHAQIVYCSSTSHAMQAAKNDSNPYAVAIGNSTSAQLYDLVVVSENLANNRNNKTRFIVLSDLEPHFSEPLAYKSMLQIITDNTEGSLARALEVFAKYHVNLTKLESRPILGSPWRELFFLEFEGHEATIHVQQTLEELSKIVRGIKFIGSFPSLVVTDESPK